MAKEVELGEPQAPYSSETVLKMLRQLPPRDRLKVIALALSEAERELPEPGRPLPSLRGLWKDLNFDLSAEDIDLARREAWASFPREDI
jgi:hypothetical protein